MWIAQSQSTAHNETIVCNTLCNKQLKSRSSLTNHRRIHATQAKTHQCKMCKKKFTSNQQVQAHQLTHTEEKPYKCSYPNCSNSYNNCGSKSRVIWWVTEQRNLVKKMHFSDTKSIRVRDRWITNRTNFGASLAGTGLSENNAIVALKYKWLMNPLTF